MADLRNSPVLMEDVWITRSVDGIPRWLEDLTVREGIRAMLKADRCLEERRRLGDEADNLCRWYGWELGAVELATALPESKSILQQLFLFTHSFPRCSSCHPPSATAFAFEGFKVSLDKPYYLVSSI